MKKGLTLVAICGLATTLAVKYGDIKTSALQRAQPSGMMRAVDVEDKNLFRMVQNARVLAFNSWPVGDDVGRKLSYFVQSFDRDPNYDGAGVKLSVFDHAGSVIYEDYFSEVDRIYPIYALRKASPQLAMEVSYGGSECFLKMLDYKDGKVVDLMAGVEPDNDFDVSAEVRPQFRNGTNAATEPYQIALTSGVGLASTVEKFTEVYRYKDGKYRLAGTYSARQVDDYIETLLARSNSPTGKTPKPSAKNTSP